MQCSSATQDFWALIHRYVVSTVVVELFRIIINNDWIYTVITHRSRNSKIHQVTYKQNYKPNNQDIKTIKKQGYIYIYIYIETKHFVMKADENKNFVRKTFKTPRTFVCACIIGRAIIT